MRSAFTAIVARGNGFIVGRADENTRGYTPCQEYGVFHTHELASKKAEELNRQIGLTPLEAWNIVASTMRRA